jgi:hypothetical protein
MSEKSITFMEIGIIKLSLSDYIVNKEIVFIGLLLEKINLILISFYLLTIILSYKLYIILFSSDISSSKFLLLE